MKGQAGAAARWEIACTIDAGRPGLRASHSGGSFWNLGVNGKPAQPSIPLRVQEWEPTEEACSCSPPPPRGEDLSDTIEEPGLGLSSTHRLQGHPLKKDLPLPHITHPRNARAQAYVGLRRHTHRVPDRQTSSKRNSLLRPNPNSAKTQPGEVETKA